MRTKSVMKEWRRAVLLVDMDAFFAAIEQKEDPGLRGRPLAITNGERGTCIITSSYEARQYGVKTGMRIYEARSLCPHLIQKPSRPPCYAQVSRRIMNTLYYSITPDVEVYSVDEAFLEVTYCQRLHGDPETIAYKAKRLIEQTAGLPCSIGVSGDRTTAKYAAKRAKPAGVVVIPPWQARQTLSRVPVQDLCGIAKGTGRFLARYGAYQCGDVAKLPIGILAKRFGPVGRRIWLMCRGEDPEPVHTNMAPRRTMGHGKVMPPETADLATVKTYLLHMADKLGERLRRQGVHAQHFAVSFKTAYETLGAKTRYVLPTQDSRTIYELGCRVLRHVWRGEGLHHLQMTALDPGADRQNRLIQTDQGQKGRPSVNQVIDQVRHRFGEASLMPARLLHRSSMPTALPPSWAQSERFQCGDPEV